MASEYDPRLDARAISNLRVTNLESLVHDFAIGISTATTHTPEELDTANLNRYPETPAEHVPAIPVVNFTIEAAELAHRGGNALEQGILEANDRLFTIETRGAVRNALMTYFQQNNIQVTDADGNVLADPSVLQIEGFARREFGDAAIDNLWANTYQNKIAEFGELGMMPAYEGIGYRNISYARGLTEELQHGDVDMDLFIHPENYPEEVIQNLFETLGEAVPCVRESHVGNLPEVEQNEALERCEQLGREIGQILRGQDIALNDNEPTTQPAGMSVFALPQIQTVDAGRGQ